VNPALTVHYPGGSYPIYIGCGLLQHLDALLDPFLERDSRHALVTDQTVGNLYSRTVTERCSADLCCQIVPDGEASKSFESYRQILEALLETGLDRQSSLIALGGGVPGDLGGFVAATFLRGIRYVQIPTTLLAQVDSSVGGKTGINLPRAKNSVGAFWQPQAVLIDPDVLRTLASREYTSGLAEVVKYGVIMDEDFFGWLESQATAIRQCDPAVLQAVIQRCCELKARIVAEDERETTGRRAILNYGHTFGHAIEAVFGYGSFPHGHAVAMGMQAAACLGQQLGTVDEVFVERQSRLLAALDIPRTFPAGRHEELWQAMQHDKKAASGQVRFIIPAGLGEVRLMTGIDRSQVLQAMQQASRRDAAAG
jgi:3-dehydroquinate synthase